MTIHLKYISILEICFDINDCFSYCGVSPDPSVSRDKDAICTDGVCECQQINKK